MVKYVLVQDGEPDDLALELLVLPKLKHVILYDLPKGREVDVDPYDRASYHREFIASLPYLINFQTVSEADQVTDAVHSYMPLNPDHVLLWTCNFAPLFALYERDPELCKRIKVAAYGSVNMRWCYKRMNQAMSDRFFEMVNNGFAELRIFETFFAFGQSNSIHDLSAPKIVKYFELAEKGSTAEVVYRATQNWNRYLVQNILDDFGDGDSDFAKTLKGAKLDGLTEAQIACIAAEASNEKSSIYTLAKIVNNVRLFGHRFQMVFADVGLGIALVSDEVKHHWVPCKARRNAAGFIDLEVGETTLQYFRPADNSNMMTIFDGLFRFLI